MNPWSAPIKQVWFDLDNTLLGSNKLLTYTLFTFHYLKHMQAKLGIIPALKLLKSMRHAAEYSSEQEQRVNCARSMEIFKQKVSPTNSEQDYRDLLTKIFTGMRPGFFPIPTAVNVLEAAALQQRSLILATNPVWPLDIVKMRLGWASISPELFRFITNGENMRYSKKSPLYYGDLLKETKADPKTTLHIGDNLYKDGHAALLGMRVYIITPRYKKLWRQWQIRKMKLPPHLIRVGTLRELKNFIEGLD